MAGAVRRAATATATPAAVSARLEQRLRLLRWMLHLLGVADNRSLLQDCAKALEGVDEAGVFHLTRQLAARIPDARLRQDLLRYDANVRRHLETINRARAGQPLQLRYFQLLALLFTEIHLDRLAHAPGALLDSLNRFLGGLAERSLFQPFGSEDLRKLAFWMATGSGIGHAFAQETLHGHRHTGGSHGSRTRRHSAPRTRSRFEWTSGQSSTN